MDMMQRSEILSSLYQEQAHLSNLQNKCRDAQALVLYEKVSKAKILIDEALEELQPDKPETGRIEMARPKF